MQIRPVIWRASQSVTLSLPAKMSEQDIVSRTIFSILILTNVVGNSLVILVIMRSRSMKAPLNYLVLNLAAADLTAGVFLAPSLMLDPTTTYPPGLTGEVLCRLFTSTYLCAVGLGSSVFSLVFIAFERYHAIMKPLNIRHRIAIKKLKIFIPACWIISAILWSPELYVWELDNGELVCRLNKQTPMIKVLYTCQLFDAGLFPTAIMLALYSRVIRRLWFEKDANSVTLQAVRRSRKKITRTTLVLSAIYAICWLPDSVRHILEVYYPSHISFSSTSSNVFHCLILLNSTVNPFIYAFQFPNFKRELIKMFCCGRRGRCIDVSPRNRDQGSDEKGEVNMEMRGMGGIL